MTTFPEARSDLGLGAAPPNEGHTVDKSPQPGEISIIVTDTADKTPVYLDIEHTIVANDPRKWSKTQKVRVFHSVSYTFGG